MKRLAFVLFLSLGLLTAGKLFAQQQMPNYVLHAAETLNAQYGANIDINNVIWAFVDYNIDLAGASADCERLTTAAPALNNTRVYLVEFQPVRNGTWGSEIWEAMVYGDLSFVALCEAPLPVATPVVGAPVATVTPSSCGTMPSRLVIGQEGRVAAGDSPNNLRAEPFVSGQYLGEIPPLGIFLVLDGPRCSVDGAWWYVNYNGTAGWTLEGQGGTYYLEPLSFVGVQPTLAPTLAPLTAPATPIVCNPTMPSRMMIGALGRVTPGIPNNVRAAAGSSGQYLGEIPAEGIFRVLAGPNCASGIAWWQVDYNGLVGWTAEGADGDYWIEPQFVAIPPLAVNNIPEFRQYASISLPDAQVLQFSPNNIIMASSGSSIIRSQVANGFAAPATLAWTPEAIVSEASAILAFQTVGNTVQWYAVQDGDAVSVRYAAEGTNHQERYRVPLIAGKAVFSPDARYLMLVDASQQIHVFDTTVGQETAIIPAFSAAPIPEMEFSPDGRYFAAYTTESGILWAAGSWEALDSYSVNGATVKAIALNNYQIAYAMVAADQEFVTIKNIASLRGAVLTTSISLPSPLQDFVLSNDGNFVLFITDSDLAINEIPDETASLSAEVRPFSFTGVNQLRLSPDGRFLAIATATDLQIWAVNVP